MTRGVQNLRISDPPPAPAALPAPPPSAMRNSRRPPRPKPHRKAYLRCVRSRSRRSQSIHRPRSHAAHGSKTRDQTDATDAATTTAIHHSVNFVSGIPFRTDDSPDIRMQRPAVRPPISNLLAASAPKVTPSTTARYQIAPFGTLSSRRQAATRRASPGLSDGNPALRGLSMCHGLGREPRRSHERSPVVRSALPLPLSPAPC